jgi:2,3-bisphosphoglycerate-independent phosphoglycerate mutase
MNFSQLKKLVIPADTKIVLLIMDGLGGLPIEPGGKTELETANTPTMDALAEHSALGLSSPAGPGIAVGSGPGHLAVFGFDPFEYEIGRGALEVLGVDIDLLPGDVAARGNFCTINESGIITDRRAGRLATTEASDLVKILGEIKVDGAEFIIKPIKEHRFAFVIRGVGLGSDLRDTDPLINGIAPMQTAGLDDASKKTASIVNQFITKAKSLLAGKNPANMILMRGFDRLPEVPQYKDLFGLNAAAIAVNGMYKGVSRLVGMNVLHVDGIAIEDEFAALKKNWKDYDFFYLHIKQTDTHGEDGDVRKKIKVIEDVDTLIPRLIALNPDVIIITGDHSSPACMKSHSWHPVPLLLYSKFVREDGIKEFGERACSRGSLGIIPAKDIMLIAMANAMRLAKYGA